MNKVTSILLVGVGGQGTILAGRVLSLAAALYGGQVKVSDIHGMAQRGGSVVTQVRFGPRVYAPVIDPGAADYIVAAEILEARRWLSYLRPEGVMIVNTQEIPPLPVLTGAADYPQGLLEEMRGLAGEIKVVPGLELAGAAGSVKALNLVLLGVLSRYLPFAPADWEAAITQAVPPRWLEVNKRAFELGRAASC
ncbi:MAG: indolepyruvate ferredoxin oxidoreductase, beta subunit [Clostridia bacterium]|nr:indolepyruvate ferredoxin oxidoreductase, beta subunit [Clostridia bacterium]